MDQHLVSKKVGLKNSIGDHLAFIGTFIWLAGWVIWMISVASKVWIPLSNIFFGTDKTNTWHLLSFFNSMQTIGILAITWVIVVTFFAGQGFNQLLKYLALGDFSRLFYQLLLWRYRLLY